MFTTQLSGIFTSIMDKHQDSIEDSARLLSQAIVAGGNIYVFGTDEMQAITSEALSGAEPLQHAVSLQEPNKLESISSVDRVLLVTRSSHQADALSLAKQLHERNIPFVSIAATNGEGESITDFAEVHIELPLKKGLIPTDDGTRTGLPFSMVGLYVYYGIKFTIDEIIRELEEDLE
ncbi:DUF2529 family protein [Niallia sp. XMNu-256]|uniref:DUF2529 family protein n=1 Tax=Niallia sp. XMNu-256 TaxID=3082444 RepID=UPI0030CE6192